jgi:Ca2+/H+ antiporter, TMEM165/GDT1 family
MMLGVFAYLRPAGVMTLLAASRPDRIAFGTRMEHLLLSLFSVAIAEIGDKTQLLALLLAARFRRPWAITAGILVATVLNHALAGWLGALVAHWLAPDTLRWIIVASFAAIAVWMLIPDRIDEDETRHREGKTAWAAFVATTVAFFFAEIGDKTQIATVVLAANAPALWAVVVGTTLGMLLANVPVVVLGHRFAEKLPLKAARIVATALFLALAAWVAFKGLPQTSAWPDAAGIEAEAPRESP